MVRPGLYGWPLLIALACGLAGCQTTPAPFDPFLAGRSTIPPPATAIQPGTAPYYNATPAPAVAVPGAIGTINVPPVAVPAPAPGLQVPAAGSGSLPRGTSVPQSNHSRSTEQTQVASIPPANPAYFDPTESAPKTSNSGVTPARGTTTGRTDSQAAGSVVRASFEAPSRESNVRIVEATRNDSASRSDSGYGYDPRYAWLKGKLEYSSSQKLWKLRYIPVEGQTDDFGGSVVLAESNKLSSFKPGDFVQVRGRVQQTADNAKGFAPAYGIESIDKQS